MKISLGDYIPGSLPAGTAQSAESHLKIIMIRSEEMLVSSGRESSNELQRRQKNISRGTAHIHAGI
jgi:hypothetical protein